MRSHVLICAAAILATSCSRHEPRNVQAAAEQAVQRVTAVRVETADLANGLELTAEFRAYQEVDVHAKVAGYLKQISVDVGDRVTAGQQLGLLEVPEYTQELQFASAVHKRSELDVLRAKSEIDRAQYAYEIAKVTYDRLVAVSKARPHLIAQQEIDTGAARWREAASALGTAKANSASIEQQVQVSDASRARVSTMMSYLRITAPFSGIVTKRYADTGAMIQAGTSSQTQAMPLVRISQVDRLRLTLPVPESIVSRIHLGGPVEVRVDSLQRVFQGKISRFAGRLDASTRTMDTQVDIPNPTQALMPGMYGYASLTLDRKSGVLALPVQAVAQSNAKASVFRIGPDGIVELRSVTIGMETPNLIEITSGLNEHDLIAVGGSSTLHAGARVDPRIVAASEFAGGH